MLHVFRPGTPFQIVSTIVQPVPVLVIYLWKIIGVGNKCFSNQAVDMLEAGLVPGGQYYPSISVCCQPTVQQSVGFVAEDQASV